MDSNRIIQSSFTRKFLWAVAGMLLLFWSCQRIEFEPARELYITTDSVFALEDDSYRITGSILNTGGTEILQHGFCWSDTGTPTRLGPAVELGRATEAGQFSHVLSDLELKTLYFVRAYAETSLGIFYGDETYFRTRPKSIDPTMTDIDGNVYNVVVIGQQAWMVENLRTTRYADGTPIPNVTADSAWDALSVNDKAYCWYNNDPALSNYGAYYTWAAAMKGEESSEGNPSGVQGVCPDGWHLPSDAEWNEMHIELGMSPSQSDDFGFIGTRQSVGDKMKGIGVPLWEDLWNYDLYNTSGFTALPVGQRGNTGLFLNVEKYTYYWSATEFNEIEAWYRYLQKGHRAVLRVYITKEMGFSVRCVTDL
jgi:uncharacterized protein (TIGR02145 family)